MSILNSLKIFFIISSISFIYSETLINESNLNNKLTSNNFLKSDKNNQSKILFKEGA